MRSVAEHFVAMDAEMGATTALLGAGKGKSNVCPRSESDDVCERLFPREDLVSVSYLSQ